MDDKYSHMTEEELELDGFYQYVGEIYCSLKKKHRKRIDAMDAVLREILDYKKSMEDVCPVKAAVAQEIEDRVHNLIINAILGHSKGDI